MAVRVTIKDYLFESRLFMQRSVQALVFSGVLIAILFGRLIYLQVLAHEHYITLSDDNRIKILPLPPKNPPFTVTSPVIAPFNVVEPAICR